MVENTFGDGVIIRRMLPSDAADAAELSAQLGYPVTSAQMEDRLRQFAGLATHVVFAACLSGRTIGWIEVGIVHHLQSESYGEIGGLVVSAQHRGRGIGQKLVEKAEEWISSQGLKNVLVRSRVTRERAHAFYLRQNFSLVKTSAVFTKML